MSTTAAPTPAGIEDLDPAGVLACLGDTERRERAAGRDKLELALHWCLLHPATDDTGVAVWGDAGLPGFDDCEDTLGGDGCPTVAAFAPEPFAATLKVSTFSGMQVLADALDLVYRLPATWARVRRLEVLPWKARRLAQRTHHLTQTAAAYVDAELAPRIDSCGMRLIDRTIAYAAATYDPAAQAETEQAGKACWDVRLLHQADGDWAGTSHLDATGDTVDLSKFYDLVCEHAAHLGRLGDTDPLGARKVKALGVIADAQAHLDLYGTRPTTAPTTGSASDSEQPRVRRPSLTKSRLNLHLNLSDLLDPLVPAGTGGVGGVEKLGPATVAKIRDCSTAPKPPSSRSSSWHATTPSTSTTHHPGCAKLSSCATSTASSPGVRSTLVAATSTTPSRTSRSTRVDHPARPRRQNWRACVDDITTPKPVVDGDINATATAPTRGTAPTA